MTGCSAYGCTNRTDRKQGHTESSKQITFHKFPKDTKRYMQWVIKLRRDKFKPSMHAAVCSEHFEETCFDRTGQTVRLKHGAVPTIFALPQHLLKTSRKRKASACREVDQEDTICIIEQSPSKIICKSPKQCKESQINDHNYSTSESPQKLIRVFSLKKKIGVSQQKTRRLKTPVQSLKTGVRSRKDKNLISSGCEEIPGETFSGTPLALRKKLTSAGERYLRAVREKLRTPPADIDMELIKLNRNEVAENVMKSYLHQLKQSGLGFFTIRREKDKLIRYHCERYRKTRSKKAVLGPEKTRANHCNAYVSFEVVGISRPVLVIRNRKQHRNHDPSSKEEKRCSRVDPKVVELIISLSAKNMKPSKILSQCYEFATKNNHCDKKDRRYYPSLADIKNVIYSNKCRQRVGHDQHTVLPVAAAASPSLVETDSNMSPPTIVPSSSLVETYSNMSPPTIAPSSSLVETDSNMSPPTIAPSSSLVETYSNMSPPTIVPSSSLVETDSNMSPPTIVPSSSLVETGSNMSPPTIVPSPSLVETDSNMSPPTIVPSSSLVETGSNMSPPTIVPSSSLVETGSNMSPPTIASSSSLVETGSNMSPPTIASSSLLVETSSNMSPPTIVPSSLLVETSSNMSPPTIAPPSSLMETGSDMSPPTIVPSSSLVETDSNISPPTIKPSLSSETNVNLSLNNKVVADQIEQAKQQVAELNTFLTETDAHLACPSECSQTLLSSIEKHMEVLKEYRTKTQFQFRVKTQFPLRTYTRVKRQSLSSTPKGYTPKMVPTKKDHSYCNPVDSVLINKHNPDGSVKHFCSKKDT